jgi:hypothetical protein
MCVPQHMCRAALHAACCVLCSGIAEKEIENLRAALAVESQKLRAALEYVLACCFACLPRIDSHTRGLIGVLRRAHAKETATVRCLHAGHTLRCSRGNPSAVVGGCMLF